MTYYDRQFQLQRTLKSLAQSSHMDFDVVIVDDGSEEPPIIGVCDFNVQVVTLSKDKKWTNPEPAYNAGILVAMRSNPDIIMLQNAECYHFGDVISYASRVTDKTYISFGCFSLDQHTTFRPHDPFELLENNKMGATYDGQKAWYNHPVYRPVGYDFCSAITAANLRKLNGYDERFSFGCGYGDNYLLARIKMLGLHVEITETPLVFHQWHNHFSPDNKADLVALNKDLYADLVKEKNIRAEHIFTNDL